MSATVWQFAHSFLHTLCRESTLAKMVWSGFLALWPLALAPCFVNNDYVTAEITCSTARKLHEVLD